MYGVELKKSTVYRVHDGFKVLVEVTDILLKKFNLVGKYVKVNEDRRMIVRLKLFRIWKYSVANGGEEVKK
ncbi:hypothetical protein CHS0354_006106 [Potamilus streckersoni]|uniref:Uncharacterized protein n=1 Tax=Potamilus streckersoni TaxID=2493646 RepID=A0AAE0W2D0_9BIVA|nr:hypothetical protein CHS0354_006106 [Potamilus streckersoni]